MTTFRVTTIVEHRYEAVISAENEKDALDAARSSDISDLTQYDVYIKVVPEPADSEEEQAK